MCPTHCGQHSPSQTLQFNSLHSSRTTKYTPRPERPVNENDEANWELQWKQEIFSITCLLCFSPSSSPYTHAPRPTLCHSPRGITSVVGLQVGPANGKSWKTVRGGGDRVWDPSYPLSPAMMSPCYGPSRHHPSVGWHFLLASGNPTFPPGPSALRGVSPCLLVAP